MTPTVKSPAELDSSGKPATGSQNSENKANESPRSNPVCLEVSVVIRSLPTEDTGNPPIREEGRTVIVFDNGAVLRSTNKLPIGQTVILSNSNGRDVVCKIVSGRNLPSVKGYVEVQFIEPVNDFWGIHQNQSPVAVPSAPVVPVAPAPPAVSPVPQVQPPSPVAPRAVAPVEIPRKQPSASLGSGPSFDDIPGLVSSPSSGTTRPSSTESASKPFSAEKPATEVSSYNLSEAAKPTSLSSWQSAAPEATAERRAIPATTDDSSGSSASAQPRDFMSKGLMAYEQPDASADESKKRVPMIVGIAALVLVGVGGAYFLMRGGSAPSTAPTAASISQSAAPETSNQSSAAETSRASQQSQFQPTPEASSALQPQAQPVVEQSRAALSAVPAVVTGPAPSSLRTDSGLDSRSAKRVEKAEVSGKESSPSSSRPTISNLNMGSPKAPVKNLPAGGDGIAPSTDVAQGTGAVTPAGLLTASGRISSQPAPPPSAPGSSAMVPAMSAPITSSKTLQDPKLIASSRLVYPQAARQAKVQGSVALTLDIDAEGKVVAAHALSGPLLLQQAAVDSVKQWKYSPGLLDGKPAAAQVTVKVEFRLN